MCSGHENDLGGNGTRNRDAELIVHLHAGGSDLGTVWNVGGRGWGGQQGIVPVPCSRWVWGGEWVGREWQRVEGLGWVGDETGG